MNRGTQTVASDQRIPPAAFWRDSLLTTPRLSLILSKLLSEPPAWIRSPVIQAGYVRIYAQSQDFESFLDPHNLSEKVTTQILRIGVSEMHC